MGLEFSAWKAPAGWLTLRTLDVHAAGEPLRIVWDGFPELRGATVVERRRDARERFDGLRRLLMWEPRGHADMYGCVVLPPASDDGDFAVLFMHNEGWSTMCGHGIIAVTKAAIEAGWVRVRGPETTVKIDSPAGRITAAARVDDGRAGSIRFRNVPSFVVALDEVVAVEEFGRIRYDLAFGGAFYAYVDAAALGFTCAATEVGELIAAGRAITRAVSESRPISHPYEPDLGFLYGTIFVAPSAAPGVHSRNVCVFADGEVDRSPTGTGVSGRAAIHHARGEASLGEPLVIESILGTRFTVRAVEETAYGGYRAIIPEVEGAAHITGTHTFVVDPDDPLATGFLLR